MIQHLEISLISVVFAIIIGLGLGIFISEYPKNKWVLAIVNLIYTIPSIALFGFLIPVSGVGNTSAVIALTIYGLLPMVRNTYTGIRTIDDRIIEAAKGMGSTDLQILLKIKLPLALPHIMSAIRNMAVMTIALAGIASFIGAGGLGVAIYRGITTNNMPLIVAGSVLISVLAICIDLILGYFEKISAPGAKRPKFLKYFKNKKVWACIIIVCILIGGYVAYEQNPANTIHIASKSYTEEYITGELLKQVIEAHTDLNVELTSGVAGGSGTIHSGMESGDFDLYPEYTGVAWLSILHKNSTYDETQFDDLNSYYEDNYNMTWYNKYGFEDTYGIGVTKEVADKYNLKTYSDLAKVSNQLSFGAESDFFAREDGYDAICDAYGMNFKDTMDLDVSIKYDAVKQSSIIEFKDISKHYSDSDFSIDNFNLSVEKGDFVTMIGGSGCGKTTILKMINGLITPDRGSVIVNGKDVSESDIVELRRRIGYAIQGTMLFPHLNVRENIAYVPNLIHENDNEKTDEAIDKWLDIVGLDSSILSRYPHELSGGQQQRVGIARALAASPAILLMDEPFSAVDEITRTQLQKEMKEIHEKTKITVMFVTHDIREALYLADKVLVMQNGIVHQFDTPNEVLNHPATPFVEKLLERTKFILNK